MVEFRVDGSLSSGGLGIMRSRGSGVEGCERNMKLICTHAFCCHLLGLDTSHRVMEVLLELGVSFNRHAANTFAASLTT